MKVFVDNCLSPTLARTLHGYVSHAGNSAHHIADLPCGRNASDLDWISMLRESGEKWLVLTGDLRLQRNKAERLAFRQARLWGLVVAPSFQTLPVNRVASHLLWRWPDIETLFRMVDPPALHEIPLKRTANFRQLTL